MARLSSELTCIIIKFIIWEYGLLPKISVIQMRRVSHERDLYFAIMSDPERQFH